MTQRPPIIHVAPIDQMPSKDLIELCDATDSAIEAGGGFGWLTLPARDIMERYWRGVLVVPERTLFLGWLDDVVAGSAQMVRPPRNNEAQAHAVHLTTNFTAPWARGHGLARKLTEAVIERATAEGFKVLNLDVRETQTAAIRLYERLGFRRIGTHPWYARVGGAYVAGHYYTLNLEPAA